MGIISPGDLKLALVKSGNKKIFDSIWEQYNFSAHGEMERKGLITALYCINSNVKKICNVYVNKEYRMIKKEHRLNGFFEPFNKSEYVSDIYSYKPDLFCVCKDNDDRTVVYNIEWDDIMGHTYNKKIIQSDEIKNLLVTGIKRLDYDMMNYESISKLVETPSYSEEGGDFISYKAAKREFAL